MTSLPTWAVLLVSIGTPVSAFAGVIIGHLLLRKGATELDTWRRREETMRMLRWASEQAASDSPAVAHMGVAALGALSESELLQAADQDLVDAVIDALLEDPVHEIEAAGGPVAVVDLGLGRRDRTPYAGSQAADDDDEEQP